MKIASITPSGVGCESTICFNTPLFAAALTRGPTVSPTARCITCENGKGKRKRCQKKVPATKSG